MDNPLVTIVTPVYNHEKYLDEYFKSIVDQTYENIELVLINDASQDDSHKIIEGWIDKIKKRFKRVVYINREKNKGLLPNCNEGLKLAEGKYICLFDSDDVMLSENIKKKVAYLEQYSNFAMVYSATFKGETFNDQINWRVSGLNSESGEIFNSLLLKGNFIVSPTVLIKRDVLLEIGGFNENWSMEDYPMWLEVAYRYSIGFMNEALVFYRLSPNSLSRGTESFLEMLENHILILEHWKAKKDFDINKAIENLNILAASHFFYFNDKSRYKEFRNKIVKRNYKIILYDIFIFFRTSPKLVKFVYLTVGKFRAFQRFLQNVAVRG